MAYKRIIFGIYFIFNTSFASGFHDHNTLLERYPSYKSTSSIGQVVDVKRGNLLVLNNGILVHLQDISVPPIDHPHKGLACFGEKSQKFLENLVLNKRIFLEKDRFSPPEKGRIISRYVYLSNNYDNSPQKISINQTLIEQGFGKFYPNKKIKSGKFWKKFKEIQENTYNHPSGAWEECLPFLEK